MPKPRMIEITEKGYAALGLKKPLTVPVFRMAVFAKLQELILHGQNGQYAKGYNEGVRDAMKIVRDYDG